MQKLSTYSYMTQKVRLQTDRTLKLIRVKSNRYHTCSGGYTVNVNNVLSICLKKLIFDDQCAKLNKINSQILIKVNLIFKVPNLANLKVPNPKEQFLQISINSPSV